MRKLFTLALALCMVLSLAACGGNNDTPSGNDTPPVQNTDGGTAAGSQAQSPTTNADNTGEINTEDHVSTTFHVSREGGMNQRLDRAEILFDGSQPELSLADITDIVMTKGGEPIDVHVESVLEDYEVREAGQTLYMLVFNPSYSVPGIGSGTYCFTCKIQGVEYTTGDYYFDWYSALPGFTQPTGNGNEPTDSGDTSQTDPASAFALDASALEAADDPLAYILQELNKAYQNQLGEIDGLYWNNNPTEKNIRLYFRDYELSSNDINSLMESPQTYMSDIERIIGEIKDSFVETEYYPSVFRFYIFLGGNRVCDITFNEFSDAPQLYVYEGDVYYQYKQSAWTKHPQSDLMTPRENAVDEYVY